MRRFVRRALPGIVAVLVAIQFVPVLPSNPPVEAEVPAPAAVRDILRRACYNCHSHETAWPWYARVAPASWLLAYDVREGRAELNFSAWNRVAAGQDAKKMAKIRKDVEDGDMPPWYYLLAHREARLYAQDRATLRQWTAAMTSGAGGDAR